eukprot:scaffold10242_cov54-Phaeocystis_antarctica.AAC.2
MASGTPKAATLRRVSRRGRARHISRPSPASSSATTLPRPASASRTAAEPSSASACCAASPPSLRDADAAARSAHSVGPEDDGGLLARALPLQEAWAWRTSTRTSGGQTVPAASIRRRSSCHTGLAWSACESASIRALGCEAPTASSRVNVTYGSGGSSPVDGRPNART